MKLIWIEINGYKRFGSKSKLNTQGKVISLIGPNEAGKSSLIDAINHIDKDVQIKTSGPDCELTRGGKIPRDQIIVRAGYLLESDDKISISHFKGGKDANWFIKGKQTGGEFSYEIRPPIEKDYKHRKNTIKNLSKTIKNEHFIESIKKSEIDVSIETIEALIKQLDSNDYNLADEVLKSINKHSKMLREIKNDSWPKFIQNLSNYLDKLSEYESNDPYGQAIGILDFLCPRILNFTEEDRNLKSDYNLEDTDFPKALINLASLAELDLGILHRLIKNNNIGQVETIIQKANLTLKGVFKDSWSQSSIHVHFKLDGYKLYILVGNVNSGFDRIAERSDGLRWFIALLSFLALKKADPKESILLVDEAESHLHYDAQADLVQMFAKQNVAKKIIFTTHSIGCLPEDLGTGVRLIETTSHIRSKINNWFWASDEPGFSPILFGMGAKTLAFIPIRYAVFTEGAVDLILLPTLLREAIDQDFLGFQIAPGLASASKDQIAYIQRDASRITFLVDSDEGGSKIIKKLKKSGVPEHLILSLPKYKGYGMVTEDFIDPIVYCQAVNQILRRRFSNETKYLVKNVPNANRPNSLAIWCKRKNIESPKRKSMAYEILDMANDQGVPIIYNRRKHVLKKLYSDIANIIGIPYK